MAFDLLDEFSRRDEIRTPEIFDNIADVRTSFRSNGNAYKEVKFGFPKR
jgi:hypothetical protein